MNIRLRRLAAALVALSLGAFALTVPPLTPAAQAAPVYFPPDASGWPGQWAEESDVSEYLAFHKIRAMQQQKAARAALALSMGDESNVPTANQNLFDVRYYDIDLTLTPASSLLTGVVKVRADVVTGPLSQMQLDLYSNMTVDAVTSGGGGTTFSRAGNVLTINLDRAYNTGETAELVVNYHGTPASTPFGAAFEFTTHNGQTLIWTLSESHGARSWWPCKDYPLDKADSVSVKVTVPTGMKTASNGVRVVNTDNGTNAVTVWKERHPIATYLVSVTSHPFVFSQDWYKYSPTDSMPIQFFIPSNLVASHNVVAPKVKLMLASHSDYMGQYPFVDEKYGHAYFPWGGGMEHQTCTSLGTFNESVVVHELGHQWFGDNVTCYDFHHIWINEGMATYTEALWQETLGGYAAYKADILANRYLGAGTIWAPDEDDDNRVFSSNLSYNKGSWVPHMLRHVVGDSLFFAGLQAIQTDMAGTSITTEQFRDKFEQVSHVDLDKFFQQWIYGEYYPQYSFGYSSAVAGGGGYDVTVQIDQTQTNQLFWMPVDVTITTASGAQTFVAHDSLATQLFTFHVDNAPTMVQLDKDEWILRTIQQAVVNPPLDRSILLVNGVDWATYGTEITNPYLAKAFWGDYTVDFWDCFATPAGGYPATLPAPLGHGSVPADVLGHYRNVIWVGNNFNGDLSNWLETPIQSYLTLGGNVLLLARNGDQFFTPWLQSFLGLTWLSNTTIGNCTTNAAGLVSMATTGSQSLSPMFSTTFTQLNTQLLFKDTSVVPNRGVGAWRAQPGGGHNRLNGARMAYIAGRPYRWNTTSLKNNIMYILANDFLEPLNQSAVDPLPPPVTARLDLLPPVPNPFAAGTTFRFTLPKAGAVRLAVFDVNGRLVRGLADGMLDAGAQSIAWDGRTADGASAAGGVYWARLEANGEARVQKVVLRR